MNITDMLLASMRPVSFWFEEQMEALQKYMPVKCL